MTSQDFEHVACARNKQRQASRDTNAARLQESIAAMGGVCHLLLFRTLPSCRTWLTLLIPTAVIVTHMMMIAAMKIKSVHFLDCTGPSKSAGARSLSFIPILPSPSSPGSECVTFLRAIEAGGPCFPKRGTIKERACQAFVSISAVLSVTRSPVPL